MMKLFQSTLQSISMQMDNYAQDAVIRKPGTFPISVWMTARSVGFRQVRQQERFFLRDLNPFGEVVLPALPYAYG
jgi:hypothetical protein